MQKCIKKIKKNAKGDNKESKQARVIHLVNSVSVHVCLHSYNVSSKSSLIILNSFAVIEHTQKIVENAKGSSDLHSSKGPSKYLE